MKTNDTAALGKQRAKPSKIKARYSKPTSTNCSYHCAHYDSTQCCSTDTVFLIFPSSRPAPRIRSQLWCVINQITYLITYNITSHGQVEVRSEEPCLMCGDLGTADQLTLYGHIKTAEQQTIIQ